MGVLIEGLPNIAKYVGKSRQTISKWITHEEFPAALLPNGRRATTAGAVDAWIIARHRAEMVARERRNTGRPDLASRVGEDEPDEHT